MSVREGIIFHELQRQVAMLVEEQAAQARRLAALEAATATECAAIASRRKADAERQRRKRHRHVIEAAPPDQVQPRRYV